MNIFRSYLSKFPLSSFLRSHISLTYVTVGLFDLKIRNFIFLEVCLVLISDCNISYFLFPFVIHAFISCSSYPFSSIKTPKQLNCFTISKVYPLPSSVLMIQILLLLPGFSFVPTMIMYLVLFWCKSKSKFLASHFIFFINLCNSFLVLTMRVKSSAYAMHWCSLLKIYCSFFFYVTYFYYGFQYQVK